jgi:hypothetical protein
MSDEVRVDWASAEVHDGKLVIALEGKPPKGWKEAFERTTHLLNHGTWEQVKLKKGEVRIEPVTPGDEDRVRHFLESVILEANSATGATGNADAEPDEDAEGDEEKAQGSPEDDEMTERLRSFAKAESEG